MLRAAIGFRVHSGWAALVAVAGSPVSPQVLIRRRVEIAERSIPGSSQPFHFAKELELPKAQEYLDRCAAASFALAGDAMERIVADLHDYKLAGCSILMSSGRPALSLEATLASHAAIHAAEGDFFRDAIAGAAESRKMRCSKIKEKELLKTAASTFRIGDVEARMSALAKSLGPPWRQDQKYAAIAAWLVLHV
jgi:hypothetical protein